MKEVKGSIRPLERKLTFSREIQKKSNRRFEPYKNHFPKPIQGGDEVSFDFPDNTRAFSPFRFCKPVTSEPPAQWKDCDPAEAIPSDFIHFQNPFETYQASPGSIGFQDPLPSFSPLNPAQKVRSEFPDFPPGIGQCHALTRKEPKEKIPLSKRFYELYNDLASENFHQNWDQEGGADQYGRAARAAFLVSQKSAWPKFQPISPPIGKEGAPALEKQEQLMEQRIRDEREFNDLSDSDLGEREPSEIPIRPHPFRPYENFFRVFSEISSEGGYTQQAGMALKAVLRHDTRKLGEKAVELLRVQAEALKQEIIEKKSQWVASGRREIERQIQKFQEQASLQSRERIVLHDPRIEHLWESTKHWTRWATHKFQSEKKRFNERLGIAKFYTASTLRGIGVGFMFAADLLGGNLHGGPSLG